MAGELSYSRQNMSAAPVRGDGGRMQLDLGQLQDSFQLLISQAHPDHLAAFFYWLDLKVAQFKVFGNCLSQGTDQYSAVTKHEGESTSVTADSSSCPPVNCHGFNSADRYADTPPTHDRNGIRYSDTPPLRDTNGLVAHDAASSLATSSSTAMDHSVANMPPLCSVHDLASGLHGTDAKHMVKSLLRAMLVKPSLGGATHSEFDSSSDETLDHSISMADNGISMVDDNPAPSRDDDVAGDDETGRHGNGAVASVDSETESSPLATSQMSSVAGGMAGSPEKVSRCPYCLKVFRYRSSYRRHVKIHEGIFSHECSVCQRKFTRKEHYVRHKCDRRPNKPYNVTHDVYRRITAQQAVTANQRPAGRHVTRAARDGGRQNGEVGGGSLGHRLPLELTSQAIPSGSGGASVANLLFTGGTVCQSSAAAAVRSMDTTYSLCSPLNIVKQELDAVSSGDDGAIDMTSQQPPTSVAASKPVASGGRTTAARPVESVGEMLASRNNARFAELCNQQNGESRRKSSTPRKLIATSIDNNGSTIEMSLDACQRVGFLTNGSSVPVSVID